jgi:uncharacterized integral membrane protein
MTIHHQDLRTPGRGKMKFKWITALVIIVLMSILFLQNAQVVTYRFLFWEMSISQLVLLPLTTLIGFVIGFIVGKLTRG